MDRVETEIEVGGGELPFINEGFLNFLRNDSINRALKLMARRGVEVEQEIVLYFNNKTNKFQYIWGKDVALDAVNVNLNEVVIRGGIILGYIHVHPLDGRHHWYVPSPEDLNWMDETWQEKEIVNVGVTMINNSRKEVWISESMPEKQQNLPKLERVFREWSSATAGRVTEADLDDYLAEMRYMGVRLFRGRLKEPQWGIELARLIQQASIKVGIRR